MDNNIIEKRIEAYEKNITTSHWPHTINYNNEFKGGHCLDACVYCIWQRDKLEQIRR